MEDVEIVVEREGLLKIFKIAAGKGKEYCFDLEYSPNRGLRLSYFTFSDDITEVGEIFKDDLQIVSNLDGDLLVGLYWDVNRAVKILESIQSKFVKIYIKSPIKIDNTVGRPSVDPSDLFLPCETDLILT